ncbi:hypothetical protein GGX14DRAFT_668071 [Mycena pura]|uniref:Uncharacterized protein n=1 Tax=Mycena pura TaxID=153505 RepID=A0AAD6Y3J7_9AGAR|nr:hypothetical protein GGX14DRAFT_668071 [Mycena pura]
MPSRLDQCNQMLFATARYLRRPSPVRLRPPTPAPPQPPAVHPILQSLTPLPPLPTAQLTAPPAACAPSLTCADRRCSRCLRRPPPVCARAGGGGGDGGTDMTRQAHMGVEVTEAWLAASVFLNLKAEQTLVFSSHLLAAIFPPANPATCVAALNVDVSSLSTTQRSTSQPLLPRLRVKDVTSPASLLRSATLRVVDVAQPASPPPRFRRPVQPPPRARSFSTRRFTALQRPAPPTHACEGSFLAARALRVGYYRDIVCGSPLLVAARLRIRAPTACTAPGTGVAESLRPTLSYLNALYST